MPDVPAITIAAALLPMQLLLWSWLQLSERTVDSQQLQEITPSQLMPGTTTLQSKSFKGCGREW